MYNIAELLYMVVILFEGYCLQYFLGSFLESRWKNRWTGLCVTVLYTAGLYGISKIVFNNQNPLMDQEAVKKLVLSLKFYLVWLFVFIKPSARLRFFLW